MDGFCGTLEGSLVGRFTLGRYVMGLGRVVLVELLAYSIIFASSL